MTTIIRLRSKHFKGVKILPDGSGSYVVCRHCPVTRLDPKHLLSCPSIVGVLFKIDNGCSMGTLYQHPVIDVATVVIPAFWQYLTISLCFVITSFALCHTQQQQQRVVERVLLNGKVNTRILRETESYMEFQIVFGAKT
ncbi:RNase H domain-containing protein [Trichonephila clavipes]|nr:RNase H domain-containing protein [Trichonephila clavipes]